MGKKINNDQKKNDVNFFLIKIKTRNKVVNFQPQPKQNPKKLPLNYMRPPFIHIFERKFSQLHNFKIYSFGNIPIVCHIINHKSIPTLVNIMESQLKMKVEKNLTKMPCNAYVPFYTCECFFYSIFIQAITPLLTWIHV